MSELREIVKAKAYDAIGREDPFLLECFVRVLEQERPSAAKPVDDFGYLALDVAKRLGCKPTELVQRVQEMYVQLGDTRGEVAAERERTQNALSQLSSSRVAYENVVGYLNRMLLGLQLAPDTDAEEALAAISDLVRDAEAWRAYRETLARNVAESVPDDPADELLAIEPIEPATTEPVGTDCAESAPECAAGAPDSGRPLKGVKPWTASYSPQQCQMAIRLLAEGVPHIEVAAKAEIVGTQSTNPRQVVANIASQYRDQIEHLRSLTDESSRNRYLASLLAGMQARADLAERERRAA